jgi:transposase
VVQPALVLDVSDVDRRELQRWLRSRTTPKALADRARIVLLSTQGLTAEQIAAQIGAVPMTVYRWRKRYTEGGIEALRDRPRPGQPRKLTAAK